MRRPAARGRSARMKSLESATSELEPPFAVVDLDAFDTNASRLVARTGGTATIRLASKSLRCRGLIDRALSLDGYRGILALTLPEAIWLADQHEDIVVGYPTADRAALTMLCSDDRLASRVTIMIDSTDQLEYIDEVVPSVRSSIRVCLDMDASLEFLGGRVHLGPLRSPVHSVAAAAELARHIDRRRGFDLVGVMSYEGQIAGIGDDQPGNSLARAALRAVQGTSARELRTRRAEAVAAVRAIAPLHFVNGGGTGSIEQTASETAITEVGAGSGLYGPALFDHYRRFRPEPAAFFVNSVVRKPSASTATVLGGGWVASGPVGTDRLPTVAWPHGLELTSREAAGEAQTPLVGPSAASLRVGDRVWFRHAKAGELCERVDVLHLVSGDRLVGELPTYRGEGFAFL